MTEETFYEYPGEEEENDTPESIGCWIVGIVTLVVFGILVIIGLFLPPFNLGERIFRDSYAILDAQNNA
ncbi:MAG: hypothetical protein CUN56_03935, partial [Phototrophicales bacterium]